MLGSSTIGVGKLFNLVWLGTWHPRCDKHVSSTWCLSCYFFTCNHNGTLSLLVRIHDDPSFITTPASGWLGWVVPFSSTLISMLLFVWSASHSHIYRLTYPAHNALVTPFHCLLFLLFKCLLLFVVVSFDLLFHHPTPCQYSSIPASLVSFNCTSFSFPFAYGPHHSLLFIKSKLGVFVYMFWSQMCLKGILLLY